LVELVSTQNIDFERQLDYQQFGTRIVVIRPEQPIEIENVIGIGPFGQLLHHGVENLGCTRLQRFHLLLT
jgi:hypothetical protein